VSTAAEAPRVFADTVHEHGGLPQIELAILSRPGGREYNEDACGHWHSEDHLCCVVADGAGGHGGGDVASKLVVRHILDQASLAPLARADEVQDLLIDTNAQLRRHQSESDRTRDMHSTVVALFIDLQSQEALWGHAGDSRLYLFRDGVMLSHTRDHSMVQDLVDAGMLSLEDAKTHPNANIITRAVGVSDVLEVETLSGEILLGDTFLLASDGLTRLLGDAELLAEIDGNDLDQSASRLLEIALERDAPDNVSLAIVRAMQIDSGHGSH